MTANYDTTTGLQVEVKQPWEDFLLDMELSPRMREGDTLSAVSEIVFVNQGVVDGSTDIVLGETSFSNTVAQVRISGGQDQENYKLSFRCLTVQGDKVEGDGMLYVRD